MQRSQLPGRPGSVVTVGALAAGSCCCSVMPLQVLASRTSRNVGRPGIGLQHANAQSVTWLRLSLRGPDFQRLPSQPTFNPARTAAARRLQEWRLTRESSQLEAMLMLSFDGHAAWQWQVLSPAARRSAETAASPDEAAGLGQDGSL